uniref:Transmembrane protein 176A n=1 Tax=Lynx canadensis TaxID=61383 RepID=A0A667G9Q7_LYNCA
WSPEPSPPLLQTQQGWLSLLSSPFSISLPWGVPTVYIWNPQTCLRLGVRGLLLGPGIWESALSSSLFLQVVQIVLGVLSGILGSFLYIFYSSPLCNSGAAIWTGAVAVLAGAVAFIYEKRGGIYWALLRTLLALAAFSTAIAAIIIGADNFYKGYFDFGDFICDVSSSTWYRGTPPPSTPSPEEVRRLHLCLSYLNMLKVLFISFQAMLLGVWALLLLASLVPVCLYCWKILRCKETDQKKLLHVSEI